MFNTLIKQASDFLREHNNPTLICHADADGICATAILQTIADADTVFIAQISTPALEKLSEDISGPVVFVDMGSSHLAAIERLFEQPALILDHHQTDSTPERAVFVNPFLAELDGTKDICTATLAWHIVNETEDATGLSPIALIGAQADNHEPFRSYNKQVLETAEDAGLVERWIGARLYGVQTKPLALLLATSYDLKIPKLKKNVRNAKQFLEELKLPDDKRYFDLADSAREKLDRELIRRSRNPKAEITHYTLPGMSGPLRDTREAATLINACGRMGNPEAALAALAGDMEPALSAQQEYRRAVWKAHEWFKQSGRPVQNGDLLIVNAKHSIPPSIAGTLCSVLTRGREVPPSTAVICLARNRDGTGTTKVSSRTLHGTRDLAALLSRAAEAVQGEGGGHSMAAGAIIPSDREEEFFEHLCTRA